MPRNTSRRATSDHGVLILSEFAGAADELKEALLVNPYDIDAIASTVQAGGLPSDERRGARGTMSALRAKVHSNDLDRWSQNFLDTLERQNSSSRYGLSISTEIPAPLPAGLLGGLAAAHRIILFLDYDGTISEITPDIANANPVAGAMQLIARMAAGPDRFRVIVISGRRTETLARLLGEPRDITLVGNHGLEIVEPGGGRRMAVEPALFMPALDAVRVWLREHVPLSSGLIIEDKRFSIALHYRLADPDLAREIKSRFAEFVAVHQASLELGEGKMVVEARARDANKGAAARILADEAGERSVPVYFGDDVTDEDAFYALRCDSITVKVCARPVPSWARYRVGSPQEVLAALAEMIAKVA